MTPAGAVPHQEQEAAGTQLEAAGPAADEGRGEIHELRLVTYEDRAVGRALGEVPEIVEVGALQQLDVRLDLEDGLELQPDGDRGLEAASRGARVERRVRAGAHSDEGLACGPRLREALGSQRALDIRHPARGGLGERMADQHELLHVPMMPAPRRPGVGNDRMGDSEEPA